jgi:tetratricopeptide (TPR) repeat protein
MATDVQGLPATTAEPAALARYDAGVQELLGWGRGALDAFREAATLDPGLALAHAGAAICLFLEERFAPARDAAAAARAAAAGLTARERSHAEAVAQLVGGRPAEAERLMVEHLAAWPRDALILQRLYFIWFWQGRFPEMLALTGRLLPAYGADGFVLGLHAFVLEQAGRCREAVDAAERAMTRNARDAWAVHALAHALYELAAFDEGVERLPPAIHPCQHLNWFRNHLVWHLALLQLSRGNYARAVAMSRAAFERAPSAIAGDLHDSIALLWRQDLFGLPVGAARWRPFAEIARDRLDRQGLLFHAAHLGMALAGAGDWATLETQLGILRARAAKDPAGLAGQVLIPLIEGLGAFADGDYGTAIDRMEPLAPRIVELGGSRAQRDVFHDTLLEACFRAGDAPRATGLLAARIARRPDHYWVRRRAAPSLA